MAMRTMMAALALGAAMATGAGGQEAADGEELYETVCRNCHGPTGKGMASFPKVVGHDAAFLTERLAAYKAGETIGPNSPLMWPIAEDLSDEEIEVLVTYIVETLG